MSLEVSTVRISQQGKDQLTKLKRVTGLKHWNVLCRWALCLSLSDATSPLIRDVPADSNVEMSWSTLAGEYEAVLAALILQRRWFDGEGDSDTKLVRAHIHRGLGQLAGSVHRDMSIEDLLPLLLT